jgi:hypothetical protein
VKISTWMLLMAALPACSKDSPQPGGETPLPAQDAAPAPVASVASAQLVTPAQTSATPSAGPASSPPSTGSTAAVGAAAPQFSVKLLDPGHEPRRALRYTWHAHRKEQMAVVLRTAISLEANGARREAPLPPLRILVAIDPQAIAPDGALGFSWHVTAAASDPDAGVSDDLAQGWAAQIVPVEHLSGTGVVTAHGISRAIALDPGTAGDAGPDAEMVVQVLQLLVNVAAPLPEEPVGKGARWQKLSSLDAKNGHATQTDTFTLTDLQGDQGALDDVVAQTSSPQNLPPLVGIDSGPPARIDSVLMSGSSRTRFELTRLVPQSSLDATTSMAVSDPRTRMNMLMHLGVAIEGSVR